jgi:uncharacterized protein YrrD
MCRAFILETSVNPSGGGVLRSIGDLRRVRIAATDGELGRVHDLYFDDPGWTVRYLVVDTGGFLPDRWGLVSPHSLRRLDTDPGTLRLPLTKTQFKAGADMHTQSGEIDPASLGDAREGREARLRAATTVVGYALETEDGEIGNVEDFLVDDKAWTVRYLRVYTKGRWDGKSVLVAPKWLTELTEDDSKKFFCIVTAVEDKAAPRPAILAPEHRHAASLPFRPGRTTPRRR